MIMATSPIITPTRRIEIEVIGMGSAFRLAQVGWDPLFDLFRSKLWRTNPGNRSISLSQKENSGKSLCKSAFIVTALNPKSIAFFVAFLPQFITHRESTISQLFILGTTFLFLCTINAALYAVFAGQLRHTLKKISVRKWLNRYGGSVLIGAGLFTATMQRST